MAKYIIKNNLPFDFPTLLAWKDERAARAYFLDTAKTLAKNYQTKVVFRTEPLRGTIQVEIDGFYYYVELYKEQ